MENLLYLLYFLPTIICALWAATFFITRKTITQTILMFILIVGIMYFSTYALYSSPDHNATLVAMLESYSLPSGVLSMELLSVYLLLHITRGGMKSYYMLLLIPGLMFTASLTTLFCVIGYDEVGHFYSVCREPYDKWVAPYNSRLFRGFFIVDFGISITLGVINCIFNIGLCIYLLYKDGYRPGGIFSFLLLKKRATPSRMIAFSVILFCVLVSLCSINFYSVLKNSMLHVAFSLSWAIAIHLICFAEYHSNLKVFSYNNLRKAHLYDDLVRKKESEDQEKADAEKARVEAIMQRDGSRSSLVEMRRQQLSLRFSKMMEEDKLFLRDDISVDYVTRELGIGRTVLSNFINYEYGTNFRGLINSYRIKYAKEYMLRNPSATQETVALASGFKDAVSYTHKFKEITGTSPALWMINETKAV